MYAYVYIYRCMYKCIYIVPVIPVLIYLSIYLLRFQVMEKLLFLNQALCWLGAIGYPNKQTLNIYSVILLS